MKIEGRDSIRETDRKLDEMIEHLTEIYTRSAKELDEKAVGYFSRFEAQDVKMREKLERGEITEQRYKEWRTGKILYGRRYDDFRRAYTERLSKVNETALAYLNGEVPEVYVENYNDLGTVTVEDVGAAIGERMTFEIVDADTVRILAAENPELLPHKVLDIPRDQRWNAQKMQSEILQGILQGESIPKIAGRLQNVTNMNRTAAVRNARTMVTSAQARGRLESMRRTTNMGIVQKKVWMSSDQPGRTRDWHMPGAFRALTVDIEEPFENELGKIMYPGDPAAAPANVYNCRCTLVAEVVGFIDPETGEYRRVEYGD